MGCATNGVTTKRGADETVRSGIEHDGRFPVVSVKVPRRALDGQNRVTVQFDVPTFFVVVDTGRDRGDEHAVDDRDGDQLVVHDHLNRFSAELGESVRVDTDDDVIAVEDPVGPDVRVILPWHFDAQPRARRVVHAGAAISVAATVHWDREFDLRERLLDRVRVAERGLRGGDEGERGEDRGDEESEHEMLQSHGVWHEVMEPR